MKRILAILTLTALTAIPASIAAPKKEATAPAATPAAKPAEPAKAPAAAPKAMPMYAKVDAIDAKAKTFSHNNKDGTVVTFMVTETTEIKNGEADAKLDDIKVGDTVSGSRIKKSATEYEVVKITKFGAAVPKEKKADAPEKPAPKKE